MATIVSRNRPVRLVPTTLFGQPITAHDPPKYTRQEIGRKARRLLWQLYGCSDVVTRGDREKQREFVRYMIKCNGEEY